MNMNVFLAATWLFLLPLNSFATGHEAGNGGGAWVCRNVDASIRWAELVDLLEAPGEFGLELARYKGKYETIVSQIEQRTLNGPSWMPWMNGAIDELGNLKPRQISGLPEITYIQTILPFIDDALFIYTPAFSTCAGGAIHYEQVVNYQDNGDVLVQQELFNSLSEVSKAALVVHEGIYAFRRVHNGDENSVTARRMVGLLFSTLSEADLTIASTPGLDSSQIALSTGGYVVTLKTINSDAISNPISNTPVTISGFYSPLGTSVFTSDQYREFGATTDVEGSIYFEVPEFQDFALSAALFSTNFGGTSYFTHLASLGWANDLQFPTNAPFECEEITLAFPSGSTAGRIDVVCTEKN